MNAISVGQLRVLCLVSLLLAGLLGAAGLTPATARAQSPALRLLWKTYPLQQRPTASDRLALTRVLSSERVAIGSHPTQSIPSAAVVAFVLATMFLAAMLVLARPLPIGAGRSRRSSIRRRPPRAGARRAPRPRARARERAAETPVFTEPVVERSSTDAPDQESEPTREGQRPLELELLALVEKAQVAPYAERERLQQEINRVVGEVRARPRTERDIERQLERQHELELAGHELRQAPRPEPERRATGAVEVCEVELWMGVVKNRLFARPAGGHHKEVLASSPIFHLRNVEQPSAKAKAALAHMLEQLERSGWRVASEGPLWYQRRLERDSATNPARWSDAEG
jgi:hypothetical protein